MRLKNTLLLLAIFSLSCSTDEDPNTEDIRLTYDLKGNVKSITCETFDVDAVKFGEVVKGKKGATYPINPIAFNYHGIRDNYKIYFTEEGQIKDLTTLYLNDEDNYRLINEFDNHNSIIESKNIDNKTTTKTLYEMTSFGEPSNSKTYDQNNDLITRTFFKYNDDNQLTEINQYDKDSILSYKSIIKYEGDLKIQSYYSGDGYFYSSVKINSKGQIIERVTDEKSIAEYDKNGFLISISVFKDSSTRTFKYVNDEHGNIIKVDIYRNDDLRESCNLDYEYDKNNNWFKRVMYVDDKPISITIRAIEYY